MDVEGHLDRLAAEARVGRARADLGVGLAGLAGLDPDQGLAEVRDRAVLEPQLRLEPELDLLGLVSVCAVAVEREVGRDEVAELGPTFELGHELGVALEEAP